MLRILCLDSVSQVHPTAIGFITRSLRKFYGSLVLGLERLQKDTPKNLVFVGLHLICCPVSSTETPIPITHKCNLTVVRNSHFSLVIDTVKFQWKLCKSTLGSCFLLSHSTKSRLWQCSQKVLATSTANVIPVSDTCLGPWSQYAAKTAIFTSQMLCSYGLFFLWIHYKFFRVLGLYEKASGNLCLFNLFPLLYLTGEKKKRTKNFICVCPKFTFMYHPTKLSSFRIFIARKTTA